MSDKCADVPNESHAVSMKSDLALRLPDHMTVAELRAEVGWRRSENEALRGLLKGLAWKVGKQDDELQDFIKRTLAAANSYEAGAAAVGEGEKP